MDAHTDTSISPGSTIIKTITSFFRVELVFLSFSDGIHSKDKKSFLHVDTRSRARVMGFVVFFWPFVDGCTCLDRSLADGLFITIIKFRPVTLVCEVDMRILRFRLFSYGCASDLVTGRGQ